MISSKAVATLFFIALTAKHVTSTLTSITQKPGSSSKPTFTKSKGPVPTTKKTAPVLRDATNTVTDVLPRNNQIMTQRSSWQHLFYSATESITEKLGLIKPERSEKRDEVCENVSKDEFLEHIYPFIKRFGRYKGVIDYLTRHKMMTPFYLYGDIKTVKRLMIESRTCDENFFFGGGDLEAALVLAFNEDLYDRIIELFGIRKKITAVDDEQFKRAGMVTSFGIFVSRLITALAPSENDGMALKRFLTLCRDELEGKFPAILKILCQELVDRLKTWLTKPKAMRLLTDLIGQPSLLTPGTFARGLLDGASCEVRSYLIKYGYREAIEECLKGKYSQGSVKLWQTIGKECPIQFSEEYPPATDTLAVVLEYFPTKQTLEEQWADMHAVILFNKIKSLKLVFNLLPIVLWPIIANYAISWTDVDDPVVTTMSTNA